MSDTAWTIIPLIIYNVAAMLFVPVVLVILMIWRPPSLKRLIDRLIGI
jgi:uncharacterized membrane protein